MKKYTNADFRSPFEKKRVIIPAILVLGIFIARAAVIASGDAKTGAGPVAEKVEPVEITAYRLQIDAYIRRKNKNVGPAERKRLTAAILKNADRITRHPGMRINGRPIDPVFFVTAFIKVESTFYRRARSGSGAMGYMQLMPRTFHWMTAKHGRTLPTTRLYNTETNVYWGVSYINMLIRQMPRPRLVTLAYNAGPNNVRRGVYRPSYWRSVRHAYGELARGRQTYLARARAMHASDEPLPVLLAQAGL